MKIIGILLLLFGLLLFVVGIGGAVMNFAFPPNELSCQFADDHFKKAKEAVAKYQAEKGTPSEPSLKLAAENALEVSSAYSDSCARLKAGHKTNGIIFSVVALVGGFFVLVGIVGMFLGRKKKLA